MTVLSEDVIKRASGQFDLESIRIVDLSELNLTDASKLSACINLTRLVLSGNNLTTLKPLGKLENLQVLDVSNNRLKSLDGVDQFPNLQILHAQGNQIGRVADLDALKTLQKLRILTLASNSSSTEATNAVCRHPSYFGQVSVTTPALEILDGEHLMLRSTADNIRLVGTLKTEDLGLPQSRSWLAAPLERARRVQSREFSATRSTAQSDSASIQQELSRSDSLLERAKKALQ